MFCSSEGKCVSSGSCNNQDRSLWTDKNGYGIESSADGFNRQQYYCPSLNAYVTNKKACQIMTKLSSNIETENVEEVKFSCGRGKVCCKIIDVLKTISSFFYYNYYPFCVIKLFSYRYLI